MNLESNEIGDSGLQFISNGTQKESDGIKIWELDSLYYPNIPKTEIFSYGPYFGLNELNLSNNNISSEGIKYLVKAEYVNNLILLSLDDNLKIGDAGIKIIKDHKGWNKLSTLNLNRTGLTDISLEYLYDV